MINWVITCAMPDLLEVGLSDASLKSSSQYTNIFQVYQTKQYINVSSDQENGRTTSASLARLKSRSVARSYASPPLAKYIPIRLPASHQPLTALPTFPATHQQADLHLSDIAYPRSAYPGTRNGQAQRSFNSANKL
jgi:hypothetical protein